MNWRIVAVPLFAATLATGVWAQTNQNQSNDARTNNATQGNVSQQTLPQQIRQKLTNQGYTDVQVVPGSFIVNAKDKEGDPITMIIGPHSITAFTLVDASPDNANRTNTGNR